MKKVLPIVAVVAMTAAATTAIVLPVATAEPQAAAAAPAQSAPAAPQLVTGLPDFTRLVEQVAPGVVSIEVLVGAPAARAQRGGPGQVPDEEMLPEIFRRFFGPGFPFPGTPGAPDADPGMPRGTSTGTGFVISADGYVLTNHHVVENAQTVTVRLQDRRQFEAKIVGSDQESDVALLKIDASGLTALRAGNASLVKPGQWAVAIGSPFGLEQSVTAGIVSATGRSNPYAGQQYVPFIQTDVAINRGNSGGPLLNTRGEVIGINSQIFSNTGGFQGVSFAIPIDMAMNVADQIKDTGSVQRGQVGVIFNAVPMTQEQARGFGLPDTLGALVNEVAPDSPAQKAGIEPGDVIRAVDGTRIYQPSDLPPLIGNKAPGTRVKLTVFREGRERDYTLTLAPLDRSLLGGRPGSADPQPGAAPSASSNPLGLVGQPLADAERRPLGVDAGKGVRIGRVEGVAARRAGIQPGDVVLRVGRDEVNTPAELDRALRDVKAGDTVMLLVRNPRGSQFIAVTPRADGE
ncbi:Do family serine endopeptidase [Luteimonas yindakuii]|uniref:Probable periplasmic serine endoprotease DegP-like n=1 Tax=Luteimonas yindakuii TaxID=2565782 RepID=A0A4Z1R4F3_9GAMM|nr:Do family serine endopeptidase [Luteimonas yindakuii]QCO68066.1 Do family serine endopeptidase [Luteimonas yindakuii]TKS54422.1 Do family serine endopeptidase [Luteimonas yindakuii]